MSRGRPTRVLYVANAAKIGGGNKVLMDLIENLDSTQYTPHLVAPGEGQLVDWARSAAVPCSISRVDDWSGFPGMMRRAFDLTKLIHRTGSTIVHATAPTCYRALGVAGFATRAKRVCHLGFPPCPGELERAFVAGPDVTIGCYEGQAKENEERIRRLKPACRVVGVPNGVDTSHFAPGVPAWDVSELRRGYRLAVAILGHISDVKGYPAFIEAAAVVAKQHPECCFMALGGETAEPGARARFENRVAQLGLSDRFYFLGFRHDVADVLRAVDIVCLPSLAEGFPLAVLEAMASARPVIATPVGGVAEAVVPGETGMLVPANDPAALVAALGFLIGSPEARQALGTAARARVEKSFSVGRFAAAIQDVYRSLEESGRQPAREDVRSSHRASANVSTL